MSDLLCYHCGNVCDNKSITTDDKYFCCNGCKTVFEIFSENDLTCYYDLEQNPGAIPEEIQGKYDFLDNQQIVQKLLEFDDNNKQVVSLYIPHIHCSSCIWILENLHKLQKSIIASQVNFPKKTIRITYNSAAISLKEIVVLLSSIGYEPYISLEDYEVGKKKIDRTLIYQLAIAGFAFGNVMFLSFPEYFEVNEYWLEQYKYVFRWLMLSFSLPVVLYSAKGYFISAYKGIKSKLLNIDVPIALGVTVLFVRSVVEVVFDLGTGFFDSLTGLVFFLLIGKFFQQKTYSFLSFERDFKSYFPIAVTKITTDKKEENIQIYDVKKGDRLLIRNQELIPVDGILINGIATIDYSFVTGESLAVEKKSGDKIFAGGKQLNGIIEMEVLKTVSQSYLTQLWSNDVFNKDNVSKFKNLTDTISKRFTIFVLSVATIATVFWMLTDATKALNVFTAVLIIACPCAIALAAPFTLGNLLRILGKKKFYLKNAAVIEKMAAIDTVIFDKTGTLTTTKKNQIEYDGDELAPEEYKVLANIVKISNHPLSRMLYASLGVVENIELNTYKEYTGKGIEAAVKDRSYKVGSSTFVANSTTDQLFETAIHIGINEIYKGKFVFTNTYRPAMNTVFHQLEKGYNLSVLSGDNEGELTYLEKQLPKKVTFSFNQKPEDKLSYIQNMQEKGNKVLMVGDGLNDAGALAQSDVGISLSENINVFSPACDAILDAQKFKYIPMYLKLSKRAIQIIKYSFVLSLCYNVVGLYFAVTGQLQPVIAAILMPLSSITIVIFTTIMTNILGKQLKE
ncbi:MAG: heavy metal translocating P-type ATPase metal-binding domain-containing protein [Flavobacteriaceae bacterium]|nr:heavy metal translocating P-type ATPase metal-binding domain-containing protein [Flavobacteriaceae bacterium]